MTGFAFGGIRFAIKIRRKKNQDLRQTRASEMWIQRRRMSSSCRPVNSGVRRTVLCILLLSGLCSCLHHYVFIDELMKWKEAQTFCREKHADLATVDNMEDMERLMAAAPGYGVDAWIGRYDRPWRWWWSAKDHSLNTNNKQHFHMWREGQPSTKRFVKHVCVSVSDGLWFDNRCGSQLPFVCYDKKNIHDLPNISIQRYVYINNTTSWIKAQAYCRLHHTDLASVRNATENALIQESVPSGRRASIGLHRHPFFDNSDGTRSSFGNWIEGRPEVGTGSCVISRIDDHHHGKWMEKPCGDRFPFMCQRKEKRLFYIQVKALNSTINLNDPNVTDAILNMIKETMKKRGMTKGFKTAWIKKPDENIFHKEEEN